ncbi:MAG: hypothetical protein EBU93_01460 [Chlamydiae bacterium]|nr:hypothetical protein [Chlamydiota bacterium]
MMGPNLNIYPDNDSIQHYIHSVHGRMGDLGSKAGQDVSRTLSDLFQTIITDVVEPKLDRNSQDYYTTVNWTLETVTVKHKETQKEIVISIHDPDPEKSEKIKRIFQQAHEAIETNALIPKNIELAKKRSDFQIGEENQLSSREEVADLMTDFKKTLPLLEPAVKGLNPDQKHDFYIKFILAVKTQKKLSTYFNQLQGRLLSEIEIDLENDKRSQITKQSTIKQLQKRIEHLNQAQDRDQEQLQLLQGRLNQLNQESDDLKENINQLEAEKNSPDILKQEYKEKFNNLDTLAIGLALLHSDDKAVTPKDTTQILQTLKSLGKLLKKTGSIDQNKLQNYAIDIALIGQKSSQGKEAILSKYLKNYQISHHSEDLLMSIIHHKQDPHDHDSFASVDRRINDALTNEIKNEVEDITALDNEIYDAQGNFKSLSEIIDSIYNQ